MESSSLVGVFANFVKEHSKTFGVVGAVVGAVLVIYYCCTISFYPSGLTIADTLFFLWVVVVFGFYYSWVAFALFISSVFWVAILAKPINFIFKLSADKSNIIVPLRKSDWSAILAGGIFFNLFIFIISYERGHSFFLVIAALIFNGFLYTLAEHLPKKNDTSYNFLDAKGKAIKYRPPESDFVKNCIFLLIYATPLLPGWSGGSIIRETFEIMGVRQIGVKVHIEGKEYHSILKAYDRNGFINGLVCNEDCEISDVNVLFTGVGANTKLETIGTSGSLQMVIPTKAVKLITSFNTNKPAKIAVAN